MMRTTENVTDMNLPHVQRIMLRWPTMSKPAVRMGPCNNRRVRIREPGEKKS